MPPQSPTPQNPAPAAQDGSSGIGGIAAAIIVVALLVAGGAYVLYTQSERAQLAQQEEVGQQPGSTSDSSDQIQAELDTTTEADLGSEVNELDNSL